MTNFIINTGLRIQGAKINCLILGISENIRYSTSVKSCISNSLEDVGTFTLDTCKFKACVNSLIQMFLGTRSNILSLYVTN